MPDVAEIGADSCILGRHEKVGALPGHPRSGTRFPPAPPPVSRALPIVGRLLPALLAIGATACGEAPTPPPTASKQVGRAVPALTALSPSSVPMGGAPAAVLAAPDLGRVFFLTSATLSAFDMNTMQPLGSVPVPGTISDHPYAARLRLVRWGGDGLAYRSDGKVHILRTTLSAP